MQHNIFCVRDFIKTESPTAVQRAFRLRFNIQLPTRKSICRWNHQFEQRVCLCKGNRSGRPRVENVRRIQESFERSPRNSTRRASRELGIPQPTVWRVLRRCLLFNWVHLFESTRIDYLDFWLVFILGIFILEMFSMRYVNIFGFFLLFVSTGLTVFLFFPLILFCFVWLF